MNKIGRPTTDELDRIEELVDEYFVGDSWALDAKFWDDGDVHLTAYSTLGTNFNDGYPRNALDHKQFILYERQDGEAEYINRVNMASPLPDKELNRISIDW